MTSTIRTVNRVALLGIPLVFALRRLRTRPLPIFVVAAALATAAGLVRWSSVSAGLSHEENVRLRLSEIPSDERSLQVVCTRSRDSNAAHDLLGGTPGGRTDRIHERRSETSVRVRARPSRLSRKAVEGTGGSFDTCRDSSTTSSASGGP